jgi:hypothetical protein
VSAQSEQERHWVGVRQRQCRDASSENTWRDSGFVRIGATTTVRHVANGDEHEKKNARLVRVASRMFNEVADRAREARCFGKQSIRHSPTQSIHAASTMRTCASSYDEGEEVRRPRTA